MSAPAPRASSMALRARARLPGRSPTLGLSCASAILSVSVTMMLAWLQTCWARPCGRARARLRTFARALKWPSWPLRQTGRSEPAGQLEQGAVAEHGCHRGLHSHRRRAMDIHRGLEIALDIPGTTTDAQ